MRKVKCYECGKTYNFDMDDFCPRCGAFNQPQRTMRIAADGSVVRNDGLNENNHQGSFVHAELHEENKERKRKGLDKDLVRGRTIKMHPPETRFESGSKKASVGVIGLVGWIFLIIFLRAVMAILN